MKKSQMQWEEMYKIIMALIVVLFLFLAMWLFRDKLYLLLDKIKSILRFRL